MELQNAIYLRKKTVSTAWYTAMKTKTYNADEYIPICRMHECNE